MPQLLHPGVYIQEVPSTTRAIEGASTSVASFIGLADRGPIYKAVAVSSFSDYQAKFCWNNGGFRADSYLSYAVRAFFDNGGKKCYIARVTKTDDQKKSTGSVGSLTFEDYTASTIGKEDAFDWNKVTDGENGGTTNSDSIKLLDFLIDDLSLPIDKTTATTIAKTQNAADGTETITVSKGTDSVTLKLAKDKSKGTLRKLDGTSIDYVVKADGGTVLNVSLPDIMHSFTIKAGVFYKDDKGSDQYGEEGNWGNDLYLEIENGRTNPESEFSIIVKKSDNTVLETLDDLSIIKGTDNYVKEAINKGSRYVCIDEASGSREVESAGFMVSGPFDNDSVDLSGNGNKDYTTDRKFEIKIDDSEFIPININESQDRQLLHLYITPHSGFDWNKVTDGENGGTTNSDSIKLLDFLIDDLSLPIDKTTATTIAKTQNAADGTETITVSKGTDSVTLKLDTKKTTVNLTRGVNIIAYTAADIGGGKLIVYVNTRFDWNKVTDGENGGTTNSDSIKLLDFLIDDLSLPIDKTTATTIAKTQNAADGTETITVSKGTDSVTLKLDTKKSGLSITGTPAITTIPKIDTTLAADLTLVANKIQEKVNAAANDPKQPHSASDALSGFKCTYNVDSFHRLYLKSGTYDNVTNTGETYSSITIRPASGDRLSKNMVENLKLSIASNAMHGSRIFSPRLGIYKFGKGSIPPLLNDYTLTSQGTDAEYQHLQPIDFTDALSSLDTKDDVSIITIPGNGGPILPEDGTNQVISDGINYCKNLRPLADCIFIADVPKSVDTVEEAVEFVSNLSTKSDHGALYFPWVEAPDPAGKGRNPTILVPPSGHMAGVYASIDSRRGVWKAPAGTEANVANAVGLKLDLKDIDQDELNPKSINAIRSFTGPGVVVWGARTLSSDIALRYIPVRRMTNFLKVSIYNGIQWAVFEPNDEPLWGSLRLNIGAFMDDLFRQGAFQGRTPSEAFFVKCDKETNPQINIDRGIVTVLVGFAPLKPAEFVLVKISQKVGQTA